MIRCFDLGISQIYLLGTERFVLIDTGMPAAYEKMMMMLRAAGVNAQNLALIFHTHGHVDHAGCSARLSQEWNVPTAIHRLDLDKVQTGTNGELIPLSFKAKVFKLFSGGHFQGFQPDFILEGEEGTLNENGISISWIHSPGHTLGSVSVLASDSDLICGDVLFGGEAGLWNRFQPELPYFAEDKQLLAQTLQKLLQLPQKHWHIGHGGALERERIAKDWNKLFA